MRVALALGSFIQMLYVVFGMSSPSVLSATSAHWLGVSKKIEASSTLNFGMPCSVASGPARRE